MLYMLNSRHKKAAIKAACSDLTYFLNNHVTQATTKTAAKFG
jgi:hypothetical protein